MSVTDVSDLRRRRRQRKIIDILFRIFIFAVIGLIGLSLILTKDRWYPRLSGILAGTPFGHREIITDREGFPVSIPENSSFSVKPTAKGFAVLTDTRLQVYNDEAKAQLDVSHDLVSPAMVTDGDNVLLYDIGGAQFRLYGGRKEIFSKTSAYPIQVGRVKNGLTAVVTEHDRFLSSLTVYDKTGTVIWEYNSISRITDITFIEDGTGIYITITDSKEGDLVSKILCYSFGEPVKDENGNAVPLYESDFIKTFAVKTELFGGGGIILVGDKQSALFDRQLVQTAFTAYSGNLIDYSSFTDSEGYANAVLLENGGSAILADSVTGSFKNIHLSGEPTKVSVRLGSFSALSNLGVTVYNNAAAVVGETATDGSYQDIITKEDFSLLVGFEGIIRIEM
ncbi:MAG: DUF5711 family protein [Ruminococcus sp.]|nr:DUF5711 family protein [Ruminococcus sp.]